ncbi:MAG: phosphopantothenoylcysteine decarboxylase [Gemmataceae bacterium]
MKILVTAGNTQTPIDQVRCITNIFTGRTGGSIAKEAASRGHEVVLLTSHPESADPAVNTKIMTYRTFDELETMMATEIASGNHEAVIHVAAVSDFRVAGIYSLPEGTQFHAEHAMVQGPPRFVDASCGKVKSGHPELWLRLTPTPKLVDRIRSDWTFRGVLVKFKLEVGIEEADLVKIAAGSRAQSDADFIVANTLEGMHAWAMIGDRNDRFTRVARGDLASQILHRVETHRDTQT